MIHIKRTYDPPARSDGRRVLVERLWPRGVKKEALAADASAPSFARDAVAAPDREQARLQDGRVDQGDRVRRERPVDQQV
jgi:uncharacterized protein YeaO (DUF488 family)